MIYLSRFRFADERGEAMFLSEQRRTCYDSYYPFGLFLERGLSVLDFEPITILYGGNGSGKSTALNVMAEALRLQRDTPHNSTSFFGDYVRLCRAQTMRAIPRGSCFVCSDDVFDYMLNLRALNEGIDARRDRMFDELTEARYAQFQMRSMEDYDRLKQVSAARRLSQSQYVRQNLMDNVRTQSNGESALRYFTEKIRSDALYLLDEPENSLSATRQQELAQFLSDSARFYNCQFVIATHSPFLLAMPGAKVYDLDAAPVRPRRWTELENVRAYFEFFRKHGEKF